MVPSPFDGLPLDPSDDPHPSSSSSSSSRPLSPSFLLLQSWASLLVVLLPLRLFPLFLALPCSGGPRRPQMNFVHMARVPQVHCFRRRFHYFLAPHLALG